MSFKQRSGTSELNLKKKKKTITLDARRERDCLWHSYTLGASWVAAMAGMQAGDDASRSRVAMVEMEERG